MEQRRGDAMEWTRRARVPGPIVCHVVAAESRSHTILEASQDHDIVVMAASSHRGLRKVFFGSLAEDVAQKVRRPMLLVRDGMETRTMADMENGPS